MTDEYLKQFITEMEPRYVGTSPSVVNDRKFHTLLHNYLIPPPEGYAKYDFVSEHKYTCECVSIPTKLVKTLADATKQVLDKVNGKFTYGAFVFADTLNKQQVKHHMHIQALMNPVPNYKEIILFVSTEDAEYDFEYYRETVDRETVESNKLFLRNEHDMVAEFIKQNNLVMQASTLKHRQYGVFNGQTLIHGGRIKQGSGIWVILCMCDCDVEVGDGEVVVGNY